MFLQFPWIPLSRSPPPDLSCCLLATYPMASGPHFPIERESRERGREEGGRKREGGRERGREGGRERGREGGRKRDRQTEKIKKGKRRKGEDKERGEKT